MKIVGRLRRATQWIISSSARHSALANPAERTYPGEEGRAAFYERVTKALWRLAETHPDEAVAVVSHGGPIALFCQSVLGLPYKRPMPFAISNCSLNVIEASKTGLDSGEARLLHLNDVCHLIE